MKVSELKALPPKILIYGPAGLGKTALVASMGERGQIHDLDGNIEVAGMRDNLYDERQSVDVEQFLETNIDKALAYDKFKKALSKITQACRVGKDYPFQGYALDSLTSLSLAIQRAVMDGSGGPNKNPEIQHWGQIITKLKNTLLEIKALPVWGFVIAHEEQVFTDATVIGDVKETTTASEGGKTVSKVQIAVPGRKLPAEVTRMFSEIWYVRIRPVGGGKSDLYIQTVPTQEVTCRSSRGLTNNFRFGTIGKDGKPLESVSIWDILKEIGYAEPS